MKLIVGLGNPGREYRDTRHNVGFMVVDEIARRHSLTWAMAPSQVPDAFVAKRFGADPLLLAKPLTFMNRSGDAVAALARYYDVAAGRSAGRRRRRRPAVRPAAGAAARIGGHAQRPQVDRRAARDQRVSPAAAGGRARRRETGSRGSRALEVRARRTAALESFITRAADAAEMFAVDGIVKVMNMYNPDATAPDND